LINLDLAIHCITEWEEKSILWVDNDGVVKLHCKIVSPDQTVQPSPCPNFEHPEVELLPVPPRVQKLDTERTNPTARSASAVEGAAGQVINPFFVLVSLLVNNLLEEALKKVMRHSRQIPSPPRYLKPPKARLPQFARKMNTHSFSASKSLK
jgi:hypothetical protein